MDRTNSFKEMALGPPGIGLVQFICTAALPNALLFPSPLKADWDTANALAASPSFFFALLPAVGPSWSLCCDSSFKGLTTQCLLILFQQLWLNRHTSLAVPLCEQPMVHLHWISTRWVLQIFEMSIHLIMSKRAANTTEWHQGNIQYTQWHI